MRIDSGALARFWRAAAQERPLMIVGAGRWGRTWLEVAARARGGTSGLGLVARSNLADARSWAAADARLDGLRIVASASECIQELAREGGRPLAIVASRPRDHHADALACLSAGLDTLVEKPLVSEPGDAVDLFREAEGRRRVLALGVELSLVPAFHFAAALVNRPIARGRLDWADPAIERRHGQFKRRHEEVDVLADNLPHAISVFRVFAGTSGLKLAAATVQANGERGELSLETQTAVPFVFSATRAGETRLRRLRLETADGTQVDIDFRTPDTQLVVDHEPVDVPWEWARWRSTLQLELGAFFQQSAAPALPTPLTERLEEYIALHRALAEAIA